jgi:LPS export ABC transporter permease LptF/LPS export ABC transporter permease LptG
MRLVERYIASAVFPYAGFAFLIFTVMLLVQQAGRIGEILTITNSPLSLSLEILVGLLPSVLVFTIPMSLLVGIATGLGRLAGDSELTALRASGIGHWRITAPLLWLGMGLTLLTMFIGLELTPGAVRMIREATLRAGVFKLESPVEPGVFNTEMPGKVIYVKEGDRASGVWQKVFIQAQEADQTTRLITARSGRIDTSGNRSELVLGDVRVMTLPTKLLDSKFGATRVTTDRSEQLRIRLDTGREALLRQLEKRRLSLEEMGWRELRRQTEEGRADERRDALYVLHRRLALCFGPLALAVLGLGLGLRTRRGGRGLGILLSLLSMLGYYLVALGGEALSRTGVMPPSIGAWLATGVALSGGLWLLLRAERSLFGWRVLRYGVSGTATPPSSQERQKQQRAWSASILGLLDYSVLRTLSLNFSVSFLTLICVFMIFTLFELWRFIVKTGAGAGLVTRYLLLLTPLAATSLAPISILVALLVSYALMARRSEATAWWASGQSLYRLALPGLLFSILVAFCLWLVQENVLPNANRAQEKLRAQIRGGEARGITATGRRWLALTNSPRLYAYDYAGDATGSSGALLSPVIYFFEEDGVHLSHLWAGERGVFKETGVTLAPVMVLDVAREPQLQLRDEVFLIESSGSEPFKHELKKPITLSRKELSSYIKTLNNQSGADVAGYRIALQRRITDPLSSIIMALIGIPLGIAFSRRSAMAALCVAVVLGLSFWATVSVFQVLGNYHLLPPAIAAWTPLLIFSSLGAYFLSRART